MTGAAARGAGGARPVRARAIPREQREASLAAQGMPPGFIRPFVETENAYNAGWRPAGAGRLGGTGGVSKLEPNVEPAARRSTSFYRGRTGGRRGHNGVGPQTGSPRTAVEVQHHSPL